MEKKTDLRIVKTKKAVRASFLELRKKNPLEKIKVRDICKLALINPSTFYDHYTDVFALSDELENETLAQCFSDFQNKDKLFSDPQCFLESFPEALRQNKESLSLLFHGRESAFFPKWERLLLDYYHNMDNSFEANILLNFVLGGITRSMQILGIESEDTHKILAVRLAEMIQILYRQQSYEIKSKPSSSYPGLSL